MNTNNNRNMNDDIRNMPLGQNTYDQEFRGGNQPYYNQGMPVSNMNVNLNGNLQQNVDTGFLSKIALVLAVLSFICCCIDWLFSIPAIICAIIALIKNKKDACAWAAMGIASISMIFYILALMTGFMDGVTSSVEDKTEQTKQGQSVSKDITSDKDSYDEDNSDEKIEFYNNNNIVIYYKGNKDEGIFFNRKEFKIYVENNSDYDIKIECDKFVINKYKVYNYMTLEVESGLRGNDTISISQSTLDDNYITEIESIEGTFTIYESGTDNIIDTFDFEIK